MSVVRLVELPYLVTCKRVDDGIAEFSVSKGGRIRASTTRGYIIDVLTGDRIESGSSAARECSGRNCQVRLVPSGVLVVEHARLGRRFKLFDLDGSLLARGTLIGFASTPYTAIALYKSGRDVVALLDTPLGLSEYVLKRLSLRYTSIVAGIHAAVVSDDRVLHVITPNGVTTLPRSNGVRFVVYSGGQSVIDDGQILFKVVDGGDLEVITRVSLLGKYLWGLGSLLNPLMLVSQKVPGLERQVPSRLIPKEVLEAVTSSCSHVILYPYVIMSCNECLMLINLDEQTPIVVREDGARIPSTTGLELDGSSILKCGCCKIDLSHVSDLLTIEKRETSVHLYSMCLDLKLYDELTNAQYTSTIYISRRKEDEIKTVWTLLHGIPIENLPCEELHSVKLILRSWKVENTHGDIYLLAELKLGYDGQWQDLLHVTELQTAGDCRILNREGKLQLQARSWGSCRLTLNIFGVQVASINLDSIIRDVSRSLLGVVGSAVYVDGEGIIIDCLKSGPIVIGLEEQGGVVEYVTLGRNIIKASIPCKSFFNVQELELVDGVGKRRIVVPIVCPRYCDASVSLKDNSLLLSSRCKFVIACSDKVVEGYTASIKIPDDGICLLISPYASPKVVDVMLTAFVLAHRIALELFNILKLLHYI